MTVRAHRVRRTLATLSLGLLLLPAASFAKGSSSSSSSHSSHTTTSTSKTTASTTTSATASKTINLVKASDAPSAKPGINLTKTSDTPSARPGINLSKPTDGARAPTINLAKTAPVVATPTTVARAAIPPNVAVTSPVRAVPVVRNTSTTVLATPSSNANHGNWFGGNYEVFDRPGTAASRVYRSDSAFSTARWLLDHKAYHVRQVPNAGYELRTSAQVLDAGTPAFDRWIEQNR